MFPFLLYLTADTVFSGYQIRVFKLEFKTLQPEEINFMSNLSIYSLKRHLLSHSKYRTLG